jgi:hypothetical protein
LLFLLLFEVVDSNEKLAFFLRIDFRGKILPNIVPDGALEDFLDSKRFNVDILFG